MAEPRRSRVLIITRNLPPLVGGMERLNWHMATELAKVAQVRIVGPKGSAAHAPPDTPVREVPLKPLWQFLLCARAQARHEARTWRPDWVLAGSGLAAPLALSAARTCRAKTAVYVHGLDVAVKHPVYRSIWLPAIRSMDRVIANSRATAALCRGAGIDPARIGILHPGVDLPHEHIPLDPPSQAKGEDRSPPSAGRGSRAARGDAAGTLKAKGEDGSPPSAGRGSRAARGDAAGTLTGTGEDGSPPSADSESRAARGDAARALTATGEDGSPPSAGRGSRAARGDAAGALKGVPELRTQLGIGDRPLLLSVGRLSARKGLREFVAQCLPRIVAVHRDVVLLIVGDAPTDALHAEAQTPESIRAAADAAGVGSNIRFLGKVADAALEATYRAANVHVFPVREVPGDIEGFGMVAVEAAAHGLPTVAFAVGGVPDAVIEGESGSLVSAGDYAAFAACVSAWLVRTDHDAVAARCAAAAEPFSWDHFGEHLRRLLGLPGARA